ncbi:UNVERIFIED_CONTAM: CBL-interacting serine/threonine-protein kinase [Sesamum calycinum]|uniref:CBL-interacting serine/threonine-protein kinase n=1 Tax=Sesamum calycinum TaxID=2727403 RepID=A0AAW2QVM4_9LAMI
MGETKKILLGKYEMGRLLGKGAFAKVYYARHLATDESVAIKVIKKDEVIKDQRMMEQIKREIAVMRSCATPSRAQGGHGHQIQDLLRHGVRPRRRGVYHRDLKPENLLLDENGDLKISDFGLSALYEHRSNDGLLHTQCGTPAYIAPEVLRMKGYDGAKADIWSCGVVLYVLLAGFLPFHDENLIAMCKKIFMAEYDFPPWFSTESKRLISK